MWVGPVLRGTSYTFKNAPCRTSYCASQICLQQPPLITQSAKTCWGASRRTCQPTQTCSHLRSQTRAGNHRKTPTEWHGLHHSHSITGVHKFILQYSILNGVLQLPVFGQLWRSPKEYYHGKCGPREQLQTAINNNDNYDNNSMIMMMVVMMVIIWPLIEFHFLIPNTERGQKL
jgi:hypothetical protein